MASPSRGCREDDRAKFSRARVGSKLRSTIGSGAPASGRVARPRRRAATDRCRQRHQVDAEDHRLRDEPRLRVRTLGDEPRRLLGQRLRSRRRHLRRRASAGRHRARRRAGVAAARHETCVVTQKGELVCIGTADWTSPPARGRPRVGQCVVTTTSARATSGSSASSAPTSAPRPACVPTPDPSFHDVVRVSSTMGRRCALDRAGAVRCVGFHGRYGFSTIDDDPSDVVLPRP
jgi:hypothetical protein